MARYLLHHRHQPGECGVVFASFKGHDSPLRHRPTLASCSTGGHAIWWTLAAVASSPWGTGAPGRCLLHIPFGISAVRESQVQPPIDRSKQAR
jgi:hypothetical protein